MLPKHAEDVAARAATRKLIDDRSLNDPGSVVDLFPSIEFETTATRAQGEAVTLRRLVLVGPWEVVTDGEDRT